MRLGGRRFDRCSSIASPPIPSSRRTSSRGRRAGWGSKKLWITSIGRSTAMSWRVSRSRKAETVVTASDFSRAYRMAGP